jgi:hypothetical protein
VLFDRSWYNRAGVERVMGFAEPREYMEFLREAPELERMWVRSGIHLIKLWFSVSRAEQRTRFIIRQVDPVRQWKLSPIDLASLDRWDDYTEAKEAMFCRYPTAAGVPIDGPRHSAGCEHALLCLSARPPARAPRRMIGLRAPVDGASSTHAAPRQAGPRAGTDSLTLVYASAARRVILCAGP